MPYLFAIVIHSELFLFRSRQINDFFNQTIVVFFDYEYWAEYLLLLRIMFLLTALSALSYSVHHQSAIVCRSGLSARVAGLPL